MSDPIYEVWRVSDARPTKTRGIDILCGENRFAAHVPVPPTWAGDERRAEAHLASQLIAQAPALYRTSEKALKFLERLQEGKPFGPGDVQDVVDTLRAALLKARGSK